MTKVPAGDLGQYFEPFATGPASQVFLSQYAGLKADGSLPTTGTIAAAGSYQSQAVIGAGYSKLVLGCKSSQAGVITVQRFVDEAGLVPLGAPVTATLVAATAQWLSIVDGLPFGSFSFSISNTGGSPATVTNFGLMLST